MKILLLCYSSGFGMALIFPVKQKTELRLPLKIFWPKMLFALQGEKNYLKLFSNSPLFLDYYIFLIKSEYLNM